MEIHSAFELYNFFWAVREALPDESDYREITAMILMPREDMPGTKVLQNVLPYFRRSDNPSLFTTFQVIMRHAEQSPKFESVFSRVCESLDILTKIEHALGNNRRLFEGYLKALQLDNASASHQQVMNSLEKFLNDQCNPQTQLRVRKVFAEENVIGELGLDRDALASADELINDDSLYIKVLEILSSTNRQNLPWDTVSARIKKCLDQKRPSVWPMFLSLLEDFEIDVYNNRYYGGYNPYFQGNGQNYQVNYEEIDEAYNGICDEYHPPTDNKNRPSEPHFGLEEQFANFTLEDGQKKAGDHSSLRQQIQPKFSMISRRYKETPVEPVNGAID
ncbi:hypothetical protein G9A89_007158 [Geosiphon pyriformis]|nr:hypothetical protein G9A89_007158 [Geosiphon pyriformis]